jgi:hypothetical protein
MTPASPQIAGGWYPGNELLDFILVLLYNKIIHDNKPDKNQEMTMIKTNYPLPAVKTGFDQYYMIWNCTDCGKGQETSVRTFDTYTEASDYGKTLK